MGLRMFEEPGGTDTKSTSKSDPTASARSSIRRHRSTRNSSSSNPNQYGPGSHVRRRQHLGAHLVGQAVERGSLLEDIRRRGRGHANQSALEPLRNGILDLELASEGDDNRTEHFPEPHPGQATYRSHMEVNGIRPSNSHSDHMSPPHRSSNPLTDPQLRFGAMSSSALNRATSWSGNLPPSMNNWGANIDPSSLSNREERSQGQLAPEDSAAYTAGFAPAHRLHRIDPSLRHSERMVDIASLANQARDLRALSNMSGLRSQLDAMLTDLNSMMLRNENDLSFDYLARETECLNRMRFELERTRSRAIRMLDGPRSRQSHRSSRTETSRARWRNQPPMWRQDGVDGLGDRTRSQSRSPGPVSWETMLTTIPPDDQIPSAGSSFDSATGSASLTSSQTLSVASASTAPSSPPEMDNCPIADTGSADDEHDQSIQVQPSNDAPGSGDFLSRANRHLDRIESLSRRLRQQRSQGEFVARHRRIVEREAELERLENTLQRLERQLDQERQFGAALGRHNGAHAERERL